MKRLLHIIATPRGDESRTLRVSKAFLEEFAKTHPGWTVDELDLTKEALPPLTAKRVDGKYVLLGGRNLMGELRDSWEEIVSHIRRFLAADVYLLSTPMWNFGIPHTLKHYIDVILQPQFLFRYTPEGVERLVRGKTMVLVASRGSDYRPREMRGMDFQIPYLLAVFGFVGIDDCRCVIAQPMDMGIELQASALEEARGEAARIAAAI